MRVVVALGGNALLRRGEASTAENQRANVRVACEALAPLVGVHELVVTHGNGPQVGLLALQGAAYAPVEGYPLDILDAETEGMLGYLIEQELRNVLPADTAVATLLTMVEVDPADPAFARPTKPIGPVYSPADAAKLALDKGWSFASDGTGRRRVVPSPRPVQILGLDAILQLLGHDRVVVCLGGGGIPTMYGSDDHSGRLVGVEGVVDKDRSSALLAHDLHADALIIATDVDAVYQDWGTPAQRAIGRTTVSELSALTFPDGSMGPKVEASCWFVEHGGGTAAIGNLRDVAALVRGDVGTIVVSGHAQTGETIAGLAGPRRASRRAPSP